jgi:predicted RNA-binding protein with RPS1 domain
VGLLSGCSSLPSNLSTVNDLRHALPVRNIIANVRNVVDFGAFVDFGGENDGLLHRSKFGPISLNSLLVGQEIGVDILGVSSTGKISLGVNGLNLPVENMDVKRSRQSQHNQSSSKRQRRK